MKQILLILLGCLPFGAGAWLNTQMKGSLNPDYLIWIAIGMLIIWMLIGLWTQSMIVGDSEIFWIHIPALVVIIFTTYQTFFVASSNDIINLTGTYAQYFYLPLLPLSSKLVNLLQLSIQQSVLLNQFVSLVMMVLVFWIGMKLINYED